MDEEYGFTDESEEFGFTDEDINEIPSIPEQCKLCKIDYCPLHCRWFENYRKYIEIIKRKG